MVKPKGQFKQENHTLWVAVLAGDLDQVKKMVEAGADVNQSERGPTPLIIAVTREDDKMVEFLLSKDADPNKGFVQPLDEKDKKISGQKDLNEIKVTPLGIAQRKENQKILELLYKFGAKD